ncbi:hypothetical protein pVa21_142 [Vibrio phage pVa-21]|nr:hypothetical protein pVa21_142 [Vibrio phage pVa-21]
MQSMAFDTTLEKQFQAIFGESVIEDGIRVNFTKFAAGASKEKSRKFRSPELALKWIQSNVEEYGSIRIDEVIDTGKVVAECRKTAINYLETINV